MSNKLPQPMWMSRKWIVIWLLGFMQTSFAQHKTQLHFQHLSKEHGFTTGNRTYMYLDHDGLMWLSARDGLNSFNGQEIKTYPELTNKTITSTFFEDDNKNLWFTSAESIYCYQRNKGIFEPFQLKSAKKEAIKKKYTAFYFHKNGDLWVKIEQNGGAYLYVFNVKSKKFRRLFSLEGNLHYAIADHLGEVSHVVSTQLGGKWDVQIIDIKTGKRQQKAFTNYANGTEVLNNLNTWTFSAYPEGDSVIWAAVNMGLGVYYPKRDTAWIINDYNDKVKVTEQGIGETSSIVPLTTRYLLVTSEAAGLLVFDKQSMKFVDQFLVDRNTQFGLTSNSLQEIYVDRLLTLWISQKDKGIAYASLSSQKIDQIPELENKSITTVYEDKKKRIWVSTLDSGFYLLNKNRELLLHDTKFENSAYAMVSILPEFTALVEDNQGHLWANYRNSLLYWNTDEKKFNFKLAYFLGQYEVINHIGHNQSQKSLIAIQNTIDELRFKGNSFTRHPFLNLKPFQLQNITNFYQDAHGYYFIADNYHRLLILQKKKEQLKKVLDLDKVGECHAFCEMQDKIWIATSKGLYSLDRRAISVPQKSKLQPAPNLPKETFYTVIPDAKGYLWLSGNNGLIRYHIQQKHWDRFSQADGLQSQEFSPRVWLKTSNGEIWLGGPNGMNVFHPDSIKNRNTFPPLMIGKIKINDVDAPRAWGNVQLRSKMPRLRYQQNTLSFDFLAIEYNDLESIRLKYRLIGQDSKWIETPNPAFVRFSKLSPGSYTLEVIATNADGIWMPESAAKKLSFYIPTPWWRTWWFYLLCIALITIIAYGIFTYRLQQALKIERIRVRISSDLHDDVGTILSGLAMQSEILELTAPEKNKPKLRRISELSRSAMSRMRDTVWAIDARQDKLENLIDRMREHAEETLTPKDILLDLQVDQLAMHKNVPSQVRQSLYLIYKEAITNAAKHSTGDKVSVKLQKLGTNGLEMTIHDNGQVKIKDYKTTGSGLGNMRMRAEQIGATFQVVTTNGFLISIQLPRIS
ncbi:two-component regulator propeller domain-containing protein [Haliscomenobacter sp.]|uniref:sensor histidine kinase n=1 Tax=Haliscomenobacter sp. TaxID=2717303 RepID=UPI003364E111